MCLSSHSIEQISAFNFSPYPFVCWKTPGWKMSGKLSRFLNFSPFSKIQWNFHKCLIFHPGIIRNWKEKLSEEEENDCKTWIYSNGALFLFWESVKAFKKIEFFCFVAFPQSFIFPLLPLSKTPSWNLSFFE